MDQAQFAESLGRFRNGGPHLVIARITVTEPLHSGASRMDDFEAVLGGAHRLCGALKAPIWARRKGPT